jgi:hypothetical protein
MDHSKSYDTPSEVAAEEGEVIVDGPDGVAVSLTPDAAIETGDRLIMGGLQARGQQIEAERRARPLTAPPPRQ